MSRERRQIKILKQGFAGNLKPPRDGHDSRPSRIRTAPGRRVVYSMTRTRGECITQCVSLSNFGVQISVPLSFKNRMSRHASAPTASLA